MDSKCASNGIPAVYGKGWNFKDYIRQNKMVAHVMHQADLISLCIGGEASSDLSHF